jgi:hypothetical protein
MQSLKRPYAAAVALIGLFALALQFELMLGYAAASGQTPLWGVLRFLSFFTVLTNAIAVIVLATTALNARNFLARPTAQTAVVVYIVIVCVIYTLLLRKLWTPSGAQELANDLLHYAMPALYLIFWAVFVPKHELRFRDSVSWLIYPALYVAAMLWRGAVIGQYPYPFLDADKLGYGRVALNIAGLGVVFFGLGLAAIWLGYRLGRKL